MTQTAILIFGEDMPWILLQITGFALLYFAAKILLHEDRLSLSRRKRLSLTQTVGLYYRVIPVFLLTPKSQQASNSSNGLDIKESEELSSRSAWASMGRITPLHDLDHRAVKPLRIYKFSPKYFLTMGGWIS